MKTTFYILLICIVPSVSWSQHDHEEIEHLFEGKSLADFETRIGLTEKDYFNQDLLDYIDDRYQVFRGEYHNQIVNGVEVELKEVDDAYHALVNELIGELPFFGKGGNQAPSNPKAADGPCVNMDFESGDFTGWTLTRGNVDGSVPYSFIGEFGVGPGPYHTIYGGGADPVSGIPRVNPTGGAFSVRLGNGTGVGARAARLKQTFMVDATNYMFTYSYAVVFQSPVGHTLNQQPYFTVRVFDSLGNSIPCGEYSVIADAASAPDYETTTWGGSTVLYKNWETVFTNLLPYIGQNVTIEFTTGDCSLTGHFGYAYVDASCGVDQITASNNIICTGDSAVLTAPPGLESYLWSNGDTTQTTTVYAGGTYSCTLIPVQGMGCSITLDITITENPTPIAEFSMSTAVACLNDPINFTDLSTISPPGVITNFNWDFGDGNNSTVQHPTHTYAAPGNYAVTLTVTSADGCTDDTTMNLTINPLPNVNAGPDQTVCDGASVTLNGSGAVSYVWDNGVTDGVPFIPAVGTTTYTVTGTDANGCVNTDQVDVIGNPLPVVNAGADQTVCDGASVTLNGSGAVSYVWDNGVTDGVSFIPVVGTTTYTVTGTDANGCVNTDQVDVMVNPLPVVDAGADQTVCDGASVTLNGSGAVSYVWDNGVTDGVPFIPAVGTTTYTVTGTDANGCVNTDQVDVIVNPLPVVDAGADQTVCDGASVTLNGSGAVSYVWDNGVTDGVSFIPAVGTTTYTVTGTDANGCVNTDQVDVIVNPLPIVNAGTDQTVCDGASVTLNGSGALSYVWDNGVTDGVSFIPVVGTTTYTVTGTDANGCVNTDQVDVMVNPLPVVDAGADQTVCDGASVTLNGSGALSYVWDNGVTDGVSFIPVVGTTTYTVSGTDANGCVNNDQVDVIVNPLPIVNAGADQTVCDGASVTLNGSGAVSYVWDNGVTDGVPFIPAVGTTTYTVTGTDANGCVNTDQVDVIVNPLPIVNAGADQTVCDGASVTLNGSGAVSYVWDNGVTDGVSFIPAVGTTTYTVTGTDANGCVNTDQVGVIVNPLPVVNAGTDQTVCDGTSVSLNGSGAVSYVWDNGVTDGVSFIPSVGTTTYTVTGTDANGCVNTDQVDVIVNPLPIVNAGADQTVCDGASVTLNGSGAVSYVWDNGVTDGVSFIPAVGTTTYTVTGTDANGCVNTDQVDVIVNPLPIVNAGADQTVCEGASVTLNGSGAVSYVWDNGVTDGVPFIPAVGTTTYTITGTDANGCVNTDQVNVTVNPLPVVDAGADKVLCEGENVTLSGTGAVSYIWDNGVTDGVPFIPVVGTTTYTVTGTDANGCINTDQVDVTVNPLPIVEAGNDQSVCDGTLVTLNATGAAGFVWDHGISNGVPFSQAVGSLSYTVIGTDSNGCSNTDEVMVTVLPNPVVQAGASQTACEGSQITLNALGSQNLSWNNGVTNGVPFTQPVGVVTYIVYDTVGICSASDTLTLEVLANPVVTAMDAEICEGEGVTLSGQGALTYAWTGGVQDGVTFYPSVSGSYTVTGTDANGCSSEAIANVVVHQAPVVDFNILNLSLTTTYSTTGFENLTTGATSYHWDFGDYSSSNAFEPEHTFPDDQGQEYAITLTAYSAEGCPAAKTKYIHVFQDYTIYVPNAFTPDGSGVNEIFKPVMEGFDPNDYTLYIFNRWGDLIFESHDMEVGWDGKFARQEFPVQDGVYTWKIEAGLKDSPDSKVFVGHVSILK